MRWQQNVKNVATQKLRSKNCINVLLIGVQQSRKQHDTSNSNTEMNPVRSKYRIGKSDHRFRRIQARYEKDPARLWLKHHSHPTI